MTRRAPLGLLPAVSFALAGAWAIARAAADWEPVSPEELALAQARVEPGADAEALFWKVWVDDELSSTGLRSTREHYVRVKVFTPKGAGDWSQVHITFPKRDVRITDVRARTIRSDGSAVPLERGAVFSETIARLGGEQVRRRSFAMPSVAPGAIVEYRYRETRYDQAAHWERFDFQLEVPAQKVVYYLKPLSIPDLYLRQMTFHVAAVTSPKQVDGYSETVAANQRAFRREPHMPPEGQQRAWMLLYYTDERVGEPERFWSQFGRDCTKEFDAWVRADDDVRRLARSIIAGAADDEERVKRLVAWCRREMRIVRSYDRDSLKAAGVRENRNARDALRQRAGTPWDADRAFAALARAAGLETRELRVPSHSALFFNRSMMHGAFLSSFQVTVRLGGRWSGFDPQATSLPWDMIPWDEEAQPALLCDGDSSRFIETPLAGPERSRLGRAATLSLDEGGTLEGEVRLTFEGHCNESVRAALQDTSEIGLPDVLAQEAAVRDDEFTLREPRVVTDAERPGTLLGTCRVKLPERATPTGRRLLLEPSVFHARVEPLFTAAERTHPVYFRYAWEERDTVRVRLPEGWKLETLDTPRPVEATGVARYQAQIAVSDDGRELLYLRTLRVGENGAIYFPVEDYGPLRRFWDLVHERDRVAVTLVRAEEQR